MEYNLYPWIVAILLFVSHSLDLYPSISVLIFTLNSKACHKFFTRLHTSVTVVAINVLYLTFYNAGRTAACWHVLDKGSIDT